MAYQEVPVDGFGGLRLDADPEEVGLAAAVDLVNVDLTAAGRLRTRRGTSTFAATTGGNDKPTALTYFDGQIVTGVAGIPHNYLTAYNANGTVHASMATTTTYGGFAAIGTPSGSALYFADDVGLGKYDGTTFSNVFTGNQLSGVAVYPVENRLAIAGSIGAGTEHRVAFSGPGTPEVFGTNDYVEVDPGDGEAITGIVTWRDQIFVFKRTKFFIFYGSSVAGTGTPIFNYRSERTGTGAIRVIAARDGVYFLSPDGLYRTTGDVPVKVSAPLDLFFSADPAMGSSGSRPSRSFVTAALSADHRFVYLVQSGSTFVYDTQTAAWTVYSLAIYSAATDPLTGDVLIGTPGAVLKCGADLTTDSGAPIDWSYTTGASDLGAPVEKLVKQVQVWGTGEVTASIFADHVPFDALPASLTLGAGTTPARGQQFYSRKGTFFSIGLSGTGQAVINRVVLGVAGQRLAGVG